MEALLSRPATYPVSTPPTSIIDRPERIRRPNDRYLLWKIDSRCRYCGRHVPQKKTKLDHIIPLGRGGPDHFFNTALSCGPCDLRKGGATPGELLRWSIRVVILAAVARVRLWWMGVTTRQRSITPGRGMFNPGNGGGK
jgi:hypothetical protein